MVVGFCFMYFFKLGVVGGGRCGGGCCFLSLG